MPDAIEESVLRSLRRITRAVDLYSRQLARQYQLTGPQLVCLRQIRRDGEMTAGHLAKEISLSQATVTGIIDRLENRGLVARERCTADRRRVKLRLTEKGEDLAGSVPSPLQERFASRLAGLSSERRKLVDEILKEVVDMMEASDLDAAPILQTGSILE